LGAVTVKETVARNCGVRRHFADIDGIKALGFQPCYKLDQSLEWILDYYRRTVSKTANATR
jgi:nucleoside-diphosphate-sugar epimerase